MKKYALLTLTLTLLISSSSYAQTDQGAYLNIDYLKVDTEDVAGFEKMVEDKWQQVYADHLAEDGLTGYYLYKVMYPGGQASIYNYTLISTFPDLNTMVMVKEEIEDEMKKVPSKKNKSGHSLYSHQYSELWKTEAGIQHENGVDQSDFMVMNYMMVEPGKEPEYLALENDIARPLHEERLRKGMMHSWRTFSVMKPAGIHYEYNFATADYYDQLGNIENVFTNDILKSVMPEANFTETLEAMYNTRKIIKSELWQLVDYME